jgi:hypothetical protein
MIKIFYDTTGLIMSMVESPEDYSTDEPHINVLERINVDRHKVDLDTLTLVQLPESEWPVIPVRK